jgi:hypothetical protein
MKSRLTALLACTAFAVALTVHAQPPARPEKPDAPKTDKEATPDNLARLSDRGAADYKKFEDALVRLVQRMRKSPRVEDQQRAAALQKAIDLANQEQIENKFQRLLAEVAGNKDLTTDELLKAAGQNDELIKVLREMLNILLTDSELLRKQEEIKMLSELIKQVELIIKAEKIEQTKMDGNRVPSEQIAKTQKGITSNTESVARAIGSKPDDKKNDAKKDDGKKDDPKKNDGKKDDPKKDDPKKDDAKSGDGKSGDGKSGDPKKGDGKGDAKGDSKGDPQKGPDTKPGDPKPGDAKQGNQQDQNQPMPQSEQARKRIQEAIEAQKKVEDELKKNQREPASKNTDDAIAKLEELKKELEKRLRQLREEELERLLANLQARCERMLAMQIEVQSGTKRVYSVVSSLEDKKPTRAEEQQSQQLSTREGEIVKEANRTLQLLSAEGSAVAFAMSLENVRDDMTIVEKRLDKYDVGEITQNTEQYIIDALKEMIEALKKKQQEMKENKNKPQPPGQPPPQRLLDLLAELKLIRSQQMQLNKRTIDYAATYKGEQTDDPLVAKELELLSKRQVKLEDMLKKIATGKNQ